MDIMHLLDRLESALTGGARIPLSEKRVVDEREFLEIIDQLRATVPEEVKHARRVHSDRERLLEEAESEAARIVAHAQDRASAMLQQQEIVRIAEATARQILEEASAEAAEQREGADRYAAETLAELDRQLGEIQAVVRNGITSLQKGGREDEGAPAE